MIDVIETAPPAATGRLIPDFPLLTEAIGGLRGIMVIGGPTGHGKSRLTTSIVAALAGPTLPVLYLDRENDTEVDPEGEPVTREVGDWILATHGREHPALRAIWGYHEFDDLKADLPDFAAPAMIVIDTVQSVVGQSGDRMRTDLVALVEWAKEQARRGYLVILVSQVNEFGEFKESKALKEGGWSTLTVKKSGDVVEVRVGKVRHQAARARGVVLRFQGELLAEVRSLGSTSASTGENGAAAKLTPIQKAIARHGGRLEFADLMHACGYSLKRDSASRKRGERVIWAAVEACEIGRAEKGLFTYPPTPKREDKTEDIVSSPDVLMSSDATPQEDEPNAA
jgi:hypothetical protein